MRNRKNSFFKPLEGKIYLVFVKGFKTGFTNYFFLGENVHSTTKKIKLFNEETQDTLAISNLHISEC